MLTNRYKMIGRLIGRVGVKRAHYMQDAMDAGAKLHPGGFVYVTTPDGKGMIVNPKLDKHGRIKK